MWMHGPHQSEPVKHSNTHSLATFAFVRAWSYSVCHSDPLATVVTRLKTSRRQNELRRFITHLIEGRTLGKPFCGRDQSDSIMLRGGSDGNCSSLIEPTSYLILKQTSASGATAQKYAGL